jgi:hypothetical protein
MIGLFHLVAEVFWDDNLGTIGEDGYWPAYEYDGEASRNVRTITYIFASIAFAPLAICFLIYGGYVAWEGLVWAKTYARFFIWIDEEQPRMKDNWDPPNWLKHSIRNCVLGILCFGLFGAFYCDWILAAITRNWAGLPSNDIAVLFWVYFLAKRLPMLSF